MTLPKERCLSPVSYGVYPHYRDLPSPVCCFRIMYIRTGALWLAYCEMLWITSQLSYWAAQAVTFGFVPSVILAGFVFTILQIVFVVFLIKGVRRFKLSLLALYMVGLTIRILLFLAFLVLIAVVNCIQWNDDEDSFKFFRNLVWVKVAFCVFYTALKIYAFVIVYKCYAYIEKTRNYFRTPLRQEFCGRSTSMEDGCRMSAHSKWPLPVEETLKL